MPNPLEPGRAVMTTPRSAFSVWILRAAGALAAGALAACAPADESGPADGGAGTAGATPTGALPPDVEAISFLGDTLRATPATDETLDTQLAQLADAQAAYEAAPEDADAIIWLGRRTAYLQRYRAAIQIFSRGIELHPGNARMYRHRGHRYISTRRLDLAIADFERAAELIAGQPDEIEPDGQPNARGIPTSSLQSNIWYHLGLAHYLKGDFEAALPAYESYLAVSNGPDGLVAISHWKYMALRRLGRDAEAAAVLEPITADMDIIENGSYHQLLLMYKGEIEPERLWSAADDALGSATTGYGVANWHLYNGREAEARAAFERVIATGQWASFGYIATEAELARMR